MKSANEIKSYLAEYRQANSHLVGKAGKDASNVRKYVSFLKDALMSLEAGCTAERYTKDRLFCRKKLREYANMVSAVNADKNISKEQRKSALSEIKKEQKPALLKRQIAICDYVLDGE